jgi:hypothetical protein
MAAAKAKATEVEMHQESKTMCFGGEVGDHLVAGSAGALPTFGQALRKTCSNS